MCTITHLGAISADVAADIVTDTRSLLQCITFRITQFVCFFSEMVHGLMFPLPPCRYPRGSRRTGQAIRKTISSFFRKLPQRRRNVLILMMTGKSRDSVSVPGFLLRRKRIETFVLAISKRYDVKQLFQIATDRRHVFTAAFKTLGSLVRSFRTIIRRRE